MMMVSPRTVAPPDPGLVHYHDARQPIPASAGASPSATWARKRAASVDVLEDENPNPEQPWQGGQKEIMKAEPRDHVCLCTSDPKIPRPRNAFILYRISYHTKVAQENPGLSNPDISKIIGDKWKKEPEDEKDRWKKLADEEKKRHQQMYPEYRYKPRRASKGQPPRKGGTSPTEDTGRCSKCNGRLLTTPDTFQAGPITPKNEISDPMAAQANQTYDNLLVDRRRLSLQVAPSRTFSTREEESPEAKRRRLDEAGDAHFVAQSAAATPTSYTPRQGEPMPAAPGLTNTPSRLPFSGGILPQPSGIPRSQSGPIPPPSRNMSTAQWNSPGSGARQHDQGSSIQLPPLRTSTPPQPSGLGIRSSMSRQGGDNAAGMAAEVMRLPIDKKLSFLSKITRQLPHPRGGRGQLIAVEGPHEGPAIGQLGDVVEHALRFGAHTDLQVWSSENELGFGTGNDSLAEAAPPGGNTSQRPSVTVRQYLSSMVKWNDKATQILRHVDPSSNDGAETANSPSTGLASRSTVVPVALVKNGYCLTESDRFACLSSPSTQWTPAEYWQWAAMLWNGIISPDLTIYACPSSTEDMDQYGSVEFQRHLKLMLVRVPQSTGQLSEATKRRVSFEVKEWMTTRALHGGMT